MSAVEDPSEAISHLDRETQQVVSFLAKKWSIPRGEALRLYENTRGDLDV